MENLWKNDLIKKYLIIFCEIICIFLVIYLCNRLIDNIINKVMKKKKNKNLNTVLLFFRTLKKILLYAIAVVISLSKFDTFSTLSVTILSGLGIITTVAGLAAKDLLTDFFGSVALIFSNVFEVGDVIRIVEKDVVGTVEEVSMRHTTLKTALNKRIIIPNSVMNEMTIENSNKRGSEVCIMAEYPISYESDLDKAMDIVKKESLKLYKPSSETEFPKVRLVKWDSSSLVIRTWIWGSDIGNANENLFTLNYNLKKEFDKNGINIPYDHVSVIMEENK